MAFLLKFQEIIDASELSDISKKTYKDRLKRLTTLMNHDVDWIILHCRETYEKLKQYEIQTQKGYINSILTLFKYTKGLKTKRLNTYNCWYSIFQEVDAKAEDKYNNLQASDRQRAAYVAWHDIITARDKLDKSSQDYLLLCLYTMIPPSRADMNMLKIYYKDPNNIEVNKYPNYIVIYNDKIKLIYNEFKSKSRKLQKYEKILPQNLDHVIRQSLHNKPRDFLIVSPRTNHGYENASTYSKYFSIILERIFKKKLSINTLRHSYVNSLDMNKLTPLEKANIARDLMHSPMTMDKYRLAL